MRFPRRLRTSDNAGCGDAAHTGGNRDLRQGFRHIFPKLGSKERGSSDLWLSPVAAPPEQTGADADCAVVAPRISLHVCGQALLFELRNRGGSRQQAATKDHTRSDRTLERLVTTVCVKVTRIQNI